MTTLQHACVAAALFAVGAAYGSFVNVVIHRLPSGKSLWRPRSACPGCSRPIAWFDNVPVLAWICLRGRCRHCRTPIALRYVLVEIGCGLLCAAIYLVSTLGVEGDVLDRPGAPLAVFLHLIIGLAAATAGWLIPEVLLPGCARPVGWLAVAPSLAVVAWSVLAI